MTTQPYKLGVAGNPIAHSLSPAIHAAFASAFGDALDYQRYLFPQGQFASQAQDFFQQGGLGLNVTVPFKQDAHTFADELDPLAAAAGAVNTLALREQRIVGFNTDGVGMVRDIEARHGVTLRSLSVLILGAGGACRGIVQPLLNAVIDYLPGPLDVEAYTGFAPGDDTETRDIVRSADDADPMSGLAFKIMNDPFVGSLTFVRVYSGSLKKGDSILNSTKGKRERIGRMMMMHSNNREETEEAFAGDIVALAGMKETTTGDTLCDASKPVILETMTFPDPVIEIAIEPKSKNDQEKMSTGLQRLAAEDPSFQVTTDIESGQTIMRGMGELHLEVLVERMKINRK